MPVIDLKRFFELPPKAIDNLTRIIVITRNGTKVGFLVDLVLGIADDIPLSAIQPPLSTIENVKAEYIDGETYYDEEVLGIINLENVLSAEEQSRLRAETGR